MDFPCSVPERKSPLAWALPMETEPFQLLVGFWPLPEAPLHILGLGTTKIPALDSNPISGLKTKPSLGLQTKNSARPEGFLLHADGDLNKG